MDVQVLQLLAQLHQPCKKILQGCSGNISVTGKLQAFLEELVNGRNLVMELQVG
jgi:hypothetical protein